MRFTLSVVHRGTVRFLTTVDVMLEKYNNCLPKKKNDWLINMFRWYLGKLMLMIMVIIYDQFNLE